MKNRIQEIKSQIIHILKKYDMFLETNECQNFIEILNNKYNVDFKINRISNNFSFLYERTLVKEDIPYYLKYFSKLYAFGYSLGYQICQMLGGKKEECENAGVLSALFNMYACIFDVVCDEYPHLILRLLKIIDQKSLSIAAGSYETPNEGFFTKIKTEDDISLHFISTLMNEYFFLIHNEYGWHDSALKNEFYNSIIQSYESEIKSIVYTLDRKPPKNEIYQILFNKSALPAWIICIHALMCIKNKIVDLQKLKEAMLGLGKSIWIADDLSDITEDLDKYYWNISLLSLYEKHNISILQSDTNVRNKVEIYDELLRTGVIKNLTTDMCESFTSSFQQLKNLNLSSTELEKNLLVWINRWFDKLQ